MKHLVWILFLGLALQGAGQVNDSILQGKVKDELRYALNDPKVDNYFKRIYKEEKLIIAEPVLMLSVTDSLFTKDPDKDLFYFITFTKSMNGSHSFYSEAVGLVAFSFITKQTEKFAEYFNTTPNLTDKDIDNWASYICSEIGITRENEELKAIQELEKQLQINLEGAGKSQIVVIDKLINKIKYNASRSNY